MNERWLTREIARAKQEAESLPAHVRQPHYVSVPRGEAPAEGQRSAQAQSSTSQSSGSRTAE